jgi:hypothetical protein
MGREKWAESEMEKENRNTHLAAELDHGLGNDDLIAPNWHDVVVDALHVVGLAD